MFNCTIGYKRQKCGGLTFPHAAILSYTTYCGFHYCQKTIVPLLKTKGATMKRNKIQDGDARVI